MTEKKRIQPAELFDSRHFGFSQVVTSPPGTLVFVSGQVGMDKQGKLVGGADLSAQADQAYQNLLHALKAAGASAADVTMLKVHIVDYKPEHAMKLGPIFSKYFSEDALPAQTLIGVAALAVPGLLIEIEATAVVG